MRRVISSAAAEGCYQSGYLARRGRKPIESCPFSYFTPEAAWWRAGWLDRDIELDATHTMARRQA